MSTPIIPPVIGGLLPYPGPVVPFDDVVPFTARSGASFAEVFYGMRKYYDTEVLPKLNGNVDELVDKWNTAVNTLVDAVNAALAGNDGQINDKIEEINAAFATFTADITQQLADQDAAVAAAIQEVIDNSIEAQDPLVAGLIGSTASQTRQAGDNVWAQTTTVTALTERVTTAEDDISAVDTTIDTGRLSAAVLDGRFEDKLDASIAEGAGRLSEASLDGRYVRPSPTPIAVFIGSSNAAPGTWPEQLGVRMGWTVKNFGLGGGGFTSDISNKFITQINGAITDNSYNHADVKYVFIADAGNDIRAVRSVASEVPAVLQNAIDAFPNAEIVIIPALWGYATDNLIPARMYNVKKVAAELREIARTYGASFIEDTWLWNWDTPDVMEASGGVHYTPAGYTKIARYVESWVNGNNPTVDRGWEPVTSTSNLDMAGGFTNWQVSREGNIGRITGTILTKALGGAVDIGTLPVGIRPISNTGVAGTNNTGTPVGFSLFPNGTVRNAQAVQNMVHYVEFSYPVF